MHLFSGSTVLAALLILAIEATDGQQVASTVATSSGPDVENVAANLMDFSVQITAVLVTRTNRSDPVQNLTVVVNRAGDYQHLFSYDAWAWINQDVDRIRMTKSTDEFDLLAATADIEKQQGLVSYGALDFYVMRNSTPLDMLSFYRLDQFTGEAAGRVQAFVKDKNRNEKRARQDGRLCLQFDANAPVPAEVTPVCIDTGEQNKTELVAGVYDKTVLVLFFSGKQKQVRRYSYPLQWTNKSKSPDVYQYDDFIALDRAPWWDFLYYLVPIVIAICCALCCWCCCCRKRSQQAKKGATKSASSTGKKSKKGSRVSSTGSRSGTSSTATTART